MRGLRVQTQPGGELQDRDAVPAVLRWGRWVTLPEAQRVSHQPRATQGCRYRSISTGGRGPPREGRLEREDSHSGSTGAAQRQWGPDSASCRWRPHPTPDRGLVWLELKEWRGRVGGLVDVGV